MRDGIGGVENCDDRRQICFGRVANDHAACLEKNIIKGWLKRAQKSFANLKSRTDCALVRAKNFNVAPLTFFEQDLHRAGSERGRIAIAAEMPEHDPLDFSRKQLSITLAAAVLER